MQRFRRDVVDYIFSGGLIGAALIALVYVVVYFYSDRERAALAWTEAVTVLTDGFVPDSVYETVREQFTEREIIALTMAVIAINGWNRINVSLRTVPGRYRSQRKPEPALAAASGND